MLSWNPANYRCGPLFIHLADVDDSEITRQAIAFLREKKIPLLAYKGGFSCKYEPHRLIYELRKRSIILTGLRTLNGRSYWTLSKPLDFGFGIGVAPKPYMQHRGFL
ncbi:unnamed protein product [Adineta ricciae]|uniref:Uncharacterized protein n=1 Tax=Adineta ricciae TaxID=249248 RepID=A0A814QJB1_ADIRI|nr:unnamed protein product [Adineta ricciae]CAF1120220.1 unnamed protein product [Adineta ricciae]